MLDVFQRAESPRSPRPAIVFAHGGGWRGGDKGQFFGQAAYLAWKHDFFAVSIGYRLSDEAKYPAAVQDTKCAFRWVRSQADAECLDCGRVAAGGGSAGAHLAALAGLSRGVSKFDGVGGHSGIPGHADALVLFNGVFDFPERVRQTGARETVFQFFGAHPEESPEVYKEASPITYVSAESPPTLLLHGEADEIVSCQQSVGLKEKLVSLGVQAEVETYPGKGHGWFNAAPNFWITLQRVETFLVKHFNLQIDAE
jgi:acetyl esterase/lipase